MYKVYISRPKDENLDPTLLERFIKTYLTQDELDQLNKVLSNFPNARPYWGDTRFKYITIDNIYFLYEVAETEKIVIVLGAKFNNKRKTFNFANTQIRQRTMRRWIADFEKYKPHKIGK